MAIAKRLKLPDSPKPSKLKMVGSFVEHKIASTTLADFVTFVLIVVTVVGLFVNKTFPAGWYVVLGMQLVFNFVRPILNKMVTPLKKNADLPKRKDEDD